MSSLRRKSRTPSLTLPDYLRPGLQLLFIGLNPGRYSAQTGKYFARPSNRFWPALSASGLLGGSVQAGDEAMLLERGIGFTDVVKRATGQIGELTAQEIAAGARALRRKLERHAPRVACVIGVSGMRWLFALPQRERIEPGPQPWRIATTVFYLLPSTSPANAHYRREQIVAEFRRCANWLAAHGIRFC
ncbi:MAG: mismatch-specific DNA-glycosylase [candidate division KSB1 bacterium]|nr:mismatch-specific DNA-glycosylase [candidate division KSB1 bacterium]MDZ7287001.1 mismatch-specific DNA-glycosylase [candidate division KSB1 bacterium]MDZ7299646.1 mismatch-specific DNA-glycosylase [candidate division KSB1 bacterium]MDZ7309303.1 mismatch-specific DNA-glycosylase [candidate division KSB1 bacterium]MDZ7350777.1 mismatch-specific DNA-glycosylase [candidate division KSB1 bacterium]